MPARTEPVIDTIAGIWCSTIARPVSRSPVTTLNTPGGSTSLDQLGHPHRRRPVSCRLGLSTTVLPAAIAGANFQTAIIIG